MNKDAFLAELRKKLSGLPQDELEERIAFFGEMIDDRMARGASEEEAVAEAGPVDGIVDRIMAEIPLTKLVENKMKRKKGLTGGKIALLLGAPLWLPLLIAAAAVLLAAYAVIWAGVLCLWAGALSLFAAAIACLISAIPYLQAGNTAGALFSAGAGLVCAGLAVLLYYACRGITGGLMKLTGKALLAVKTRLVGKEG
ncbi:MAG: DUF1700 domain-containing protein [Clostridia bacterium]|nr:DUF1700 domain-containing protein [Clostridia bacterium]